DFLYNGGSELNGTTTWYETFFRGYDPVLGRFNQIDPMAHASSSFTPYNYAFNDPVFFNDPNGDYPPGTIEKMWGGGHGLYGNGWGGAIGVGSPKHIYIGSGNHWSDQYASSSYMSAGDFINSALNSKYGGAWSDGQAYYFKSDEEAFAAGVAYNFHHNSWGNTYYGSYEATLVGYMAHKVSGELLSPEAVHTAIDIVRNKHMYDGRPDFLASTGPGTPDPTYSYAGIDGLSAWELYGVILADKTIEQFGIKDIAALTGILAGQPLLAKRFITPGSSSGTSPLSKFLSNRLGTSPIRLPTIVANSGRVGIAMTKSVGKFVARGIPILGWGILAYDATMILYNTQVEYNRITNGD